MVHRKREIALLFGGRSAEHEISIRSARAVFDNLTPHHAAVSCLYISRSGRWRPVPHPHLPEAELNRGVFNSFLPWEGKPSGSIPPSDIYFPILHGPFGEDGTIQGLFELADVPYVGAAVLASAAGMDKAVAKALFQTEGLAVAPFRVIREPDWKANPEGVRKTLKERLRPPLFVKPANLGSSIGISKVRDEGEISSAMDTAFRYDRKILVEESIDGREIECSVLGNDAPRASLPGEVIPSRDFYDYRDKYLDGRTGFGIPADLPRELTEEIQSMAVAAFRAVEGSGMARVDFFIQDEPRRVIINEINTIPGFTEISMYPKLWEVSGLPFPRLLEELIELGMERHRHRLRGRLESGT